MQVASAAVVTRIALYTEIDYQHVDVLVDNNGTPYSTVLYTDNTIVGNGYMFATAADSDTAAAAGPTTTVDAATTETASTEPTSAVASTANDKVIVTTALATTGATADTSVPATAMETVGATVSLGAESSPSESTAAALTTSPEVETAVTTTTQATTTQVTSSTAAGATATSSSQTYSGDATYYDVGLGACGITNTDSELVAAMNWQQWDEFGSMSNGNPICGKQAILYYGSKSVTVTIEDKCPGCGYGSIDLSPAAFTQLADESLGRIPITWHWL